MGLKLQTPVEVEPSRIGLSYEDRVMVLGSCFADNIGKKLMDYGFKATVNPFGTLYNPVSITNAISRMASGVPFSEEDVVPVGAGDGRFCSFFHHTSFARESVGAFLEQANAALSQASDDWQRANKVILTLGTAWAFRREDTGETVANCLKHPFQRYPSKQFILTVSPIRHLADGAHGNQLSKSTLLLGVDAALSQSSPQEAEYFPAYEIVLDELRDYRFYARDMVHPSEVAVDYLWDCFLEWALPAEERPRYETEVKAFKAASHRPRL